jgi:uncharacterized protein YegL
MWGLKNFGEGGMPAARVTSETPWHTVLVIDDSGSMEGQAVRDVNMALETMIAEMAMLAGGNKKPYFKVSIVKFGSIVETTAEAQSPADLEMQLSSVANFGAQSGTTNLAAALGEAASILRRNPGSPTDYQPWVFLFSDGRPDDPNAAIQAAGQLKSQQVAAGAPFVVAFGFGDVDDGLMKQICSNSEAYKRIASSTDLLKIMPQIGTVAKTASSNQQMLQGIKSI